MPRPKSEPSYLVHKRTGRAYTIIDRRQLQLGPAGTPESLARFDAIRAQWLANGRQLPQDKPVVTTPGSSGPTVAMLLAEFWRHAQTYYTRPQLDDAGQPVIGTDGQKVMLPTPHLSHFRGIIRLLNRLHGNLPIKDFGCPELEAARNVMIAPSTDPKTGLPRRGWARTHTNRQVNRVRVIFQWGVTKKLVPVDVYATLKLLPGLRRGKTQARETKKVKPVERARALAVVAHVSRQVGAMIKLQLLTGARSTELCIMRPIDIDRAEKPWVYRPMFHKTEEHDIAREIRLGPKARKLIRPFLRDRESTAFLFSPAEAQAERHVKQRKARKTHVQPSQVLRSQRAALRKSKRWAPGNRYTESSYYIAIRRGCEKAFAMPEEYQPDLADKPLDADAPEVRNAKLKRQHERAQLRNQWHEANGWHPHQIRHRNATDLRSAGGIEVAQVQLGHSNTRTTEIYAEADLKRAGEVVERIG